MFRHSVTALFCLLCLFFNACTNPEQVAQEKPPTDSLTEAEKHLPVNALKGLVVADGLEVTPFAAEPMLQNPTNLDVDEKGRAWLTEAYNYRPGINGNPTNALGDRIMILEDTNGDGHADTAKVFYQGPELNAPLGIAVLGNRVIISQSPYVWAFYDDNGDDKADRKELLFQGIGGEQHDHGVHAFSFGPDGKLYFNMGNEAQTLKDAKGKIILDGKKYKQGLALRCDPDGSNVEVLGENFRNPFEVAVDSYGAVWQSDNDDDGNKGTRINAVFPHGQYGYTDELTGAGWQSNRTNMEDSIPFRHWHLNDPGAMPNMLQTGAGSPTGIAVYEGSLLPERFRGQLIHTDAGPNVVRAYKVSAVGAGYTASIENILKGDNDPWFRPADISVAPDGSLLVVDWYDPGVGGHAAGDQVKGRVYRIAPKGKAYTIPAYDYSSPEAAIKALQSPNLSARYHAFTVLQNMGATALPALEASWKNIALDPRWRARAFWVLVKTKSPSAAEYISEASNDKNESIRAMAMRAAVQTGNVFGQLAEKLATDPSPAVRRELALALWNRKDPRAASVWTTLALAYDGKDRWYLEALGIGAATNWDAFFTSWLNAVKDPLSTAAGRDIVWRARTEKAVPYLSSLAGDAAVPIASRLRYFRAFDFIPDKTKYKALMGLLEANSKQDMALNKLVLHALDIPSVQNSVVARKALDAVLDTVKGSDEFVVLVARYQMKSRNKDLMSMAIANADEGKGRDAAGLLLKLGGQSDIAAVLAADNRDSKEKLIKSLGGVGNAASISILEKIALSAKNDSSFRKLAAEKLGRSGSGEDRVLVLLRSKKVPEFLIAPMITSVQHSWRGAVRDEAKSYIPSGGKQEGDKIPLWADISALKGDKEAGHTVYVNSCGLCHLAGKEGFDFGPALTDIGGKLPKEGLLAAIVNPSAGISFGYEGWDLTMKDGSVLSGILSSKTETDLDMKFPGGSKKQIKTSTVKTMSQQKKSMMTEGLYANMSSQDMANLLEYLHTLKKN